jgi:hypothetical protein
LLHELDDTPFEYARFIPYPETPLIIIVSRITLSPLPKPDGVGFFLVIYHSARANLSQVPDKIIDDALLIGKTPLLHATSVSVSATPCKTATIEPLFLPFDRRIMNEDDT